MTIAWFIHHLLHLHGHIILIHCHGLGCRVPSGVQPHPFIPYP